MTAVVNTATGEIVDACTADEAREITDRIKGAAESIWSLLLEAHEKKAWAALGYATWELYVRAEFDMGRQYAYRLLDQARVIREIGAVSPMGDIEISEREAREIKPVLTEVKEAVAERVAALPDPTPEAVKETVREVVTEKREQVRETKAAPKVTDDDRAYYLRYDTAVGRSFRTVLDFDADRLGPLMTAAEVETLRGLYRSVGDFLRKVENSRRGMRVVKGGKS